MRELTDREIYRFDIQGFLVIPGVLSPDEIDELTASVDANPDRRTETPGADGSRALAGVGRRYTYWSVLQWPSPWCLPFRQLIAHPRMVPYLTALLGNGWHLDHNPEVLAVEPDGEGQVMHFGHWWNHPGVFYSAKAGQIRNGLLAVEYILSDQPEGRGGFCCIPGSHKANFECPDAISRGESDGDIVVNPGARAGDVIVFTEALAHGSLPWRNEHTRRLAIYRYTPKCVQYGGGVHTVGLPDWVDELTPEQRAAVQPAHFYDRQVITDEGVETVWDQYDIPRYPYR